MSDLLICDCEFCKAEERLSEAEFRMFSDILLEKVEENGWTLPIENMKNAQWESFIRDDVLDELDRRIASG